MSATVTAASRDNAPSRGRIENGDDQSAQAARLLFRAARYRNCDEEAAVEFVRRAMELLERQVNTSGKPAPSAGGLAQWQVKRLELHIENSISRPIALHELAAVSRLSTSHFSAAFKISFGLPPHAYLIERRVAFAKTRMLTSDAPLSEIALDCGFADQAHLSRVFRRVTGMPPNVWRRSRREASAGTEQSNTGRH